ncbi:hypothetical protein GEV33_006872 [Tenebrio molitor]|uniref:Uncharacterized protein n=1 Tax=Tenebrio molitor TaxID=7067 RepID=A0A8J6LBL8_TENMO|nr:hypothetical protein GEV33_006872 [Tenebrio molitor]
MTAEQREIKRVKDKTYYQKKKAEKKVKPIAQMTEQEKRKQRKHWKKASQKYRSFATLSDNLDHQAHAVWVHMKPILTTILENKDVDTLQIYSDGPTSQYRNRTNINLWLQTLINEFKQITKATWIFSEPGHGKGPMDGVGGHLKRTADSHVLMGKDIKTALDFVNLFTESVIQVKVIPDDDIARAKNIVPKTLDAMPGIMNITKITWERGPEVLIRLYRYEHFHKELKLTTFSNNLNVKSIELMDVSIESPNPEKPMDTNDFEDLTFEKKQKSNSVQAEQNLFHLPQPTVYRQTPEIPITATGASRQLLRVAYSRTCSTSVIRSYITVAPTET